VFILLAILVSSSAFSSILLKPKGSDSFRLLAKSVIGNVEICQQVATTDLNLVFHNESQQRMEADFIYTVPPGSVVTHFAYWYGNEKVVARVVEKERAAQIYQHITSRMRDPALIELVGKNLFRARIFPIMPNADLKIEIIYAQTLQSDKDGVTYKLLLSDTCENSNALSQIDINVRIRADRNIVGVSNNIGIPVARDEKGWKVAFSGQNYRPQKDMTVRMKSKRKTLRTNLYAARSGGSDGFFTLAVTPDHSLISPKIHITGVQTYSVFPSILPNIKADRALVIYGRYKGSGNSTVTLVGSSPDGKLTYRDSIFFGSKSEANNPATKLWAAKQIEELSKNKKNQYAVIKLSTRYTIPSAFTSWLAIPQEERKRYAQEMKQAEVSVLAKRLAYLIVNGKEYTAQAKAMKDKYLSLCKSTGRNSKYELESSTFREYWSLYNQLIDMIATGRSGSVQAQEIERLLHNVAKNRRYLQSKYFGNVLEDKVRDVATQLAAEQLSEKPNAQHIKSLQKQLVRLDRKIKKDTTQIKIRAKKAYITSQQDKIFYQATVEINDSRGDQKRIDQLRAKLRDLDSHYQSLDYTQAYDEYIRNSMGDHKRIDQLRAKMRDLNSHYQGPEYAQEYDEYFEWTLEYDVIVRKYQNAYNSNSIDTNELRKQLEKHNKSRKPSWEKFRYRGGDPLISIEAPVDAQQVIALMPDGEVKPLLYNTSSGKWEAQFDIPAYAKESTYTVQVIIVLKDGTRKVVKITYSVDITPPNGIASAKMVNTDGSILRLELEADPDTARVAVILPWQKRVEMKPSDTPNKFFTTVPVPKDYADNSFAVTFILTDNAHNRTSVTVDTSAEKAQ